MSVVYQADIFCDGKSEGCVSFVEQGETYRDTTAGISKGAWKVARSQGWVQKNEGGRRVHYCPKCQEAVA